MAFELIPTPSFIKEVKALAKRYSSLKNDLLKLEALLLKKPVFGEPLGKDCYKIRMAIASKAKGKSSGARVITCVKVIRQRIFLLAIYDKSEMENIDDKVLIDRLKAIDTDNL